MPERERVSKAQRFYRGLGAVGGVMVVALADWLGKGQVPVAQIARSGLSGNGARSGTQLLRTVGTEQKWSWSQFPLSIPPCHVAYGPNHGTGCIAIWLFFCY